MTNNCLHQITYFEDGNERCSSCGGHRPKGRAKWVMDPKRHASSLRPKEKK